MCAINVSKINSKEQYEPVILLYYAYINYGDSQNNISCFSFSVCSNVCSVHKWKKLKYLNLNQRLDVITCDLSSTSPPDGNQVDGLPSVVNSL